MQREIEGISKITTWDKMKRELKRKYLPKNYRHDIFFKTQKLKQKKSRSYGVSYTRWNHGNALHWRLVFDYNTHG